MITILSVVLPFVWMAVALYSKRFTAGLPILAGMAYTGSGEATIADDTVESPKDPGTKPPVKPARHGRHCKAGLI